MLDLSAARAAYPGVVLEDSVFAEYLAARNIDTSSACITDLWLACALERGDAAALRTFAAIVPDEVVPAIAHLDGGTALAGDVIAAVHARVLGDGAPGKITAYSGRGALRGWLRVIAVREALQLMRHRRREAAPLDDDALADRLGSADATEPSARERDVHREAFRAALASLTPRDRNLLRQHYLHGATVDELGALYGVHRATAARWIAEVRTTLLDGTRRHLADALRLTGEDLSRELDDVAANLEISLRHTLSRER